MNIDTTQEYNQDSENTNHIRPEALAGKIAASFISQVFGDEEQPDFRFIDLLCQMATDEDKKISKAANTAIFKIIIERLCDDFSPIGAETCAQVLVRIIAFIRKIPSVHKLDTLLDDSGYHDTRKLLDRYERVKKNSVIPSLRSKNVKKILILSRVTAGADIAITNIIAHRLIKSFPEAEITLIGPAKHLTEMFEDLSATRVVQFSYNNSGSLIEKMTNWPSLRETVTREIQEFKEEEVLLFDPDSRLSQLGILPLANEHNTFLFPSRTIGYTDIDQQTLTALVNRWLNQLLNENEFVSPQISFHQPNPGYTNLISKLRENGCRLIITINFGVGHDYRKKMPPPFESNLIEKLLSIKDTVVILDSGKSLEEQQNTRNHINRLQHDGFNTMTIEDKYLNAEKIHFGGGIISYNGPLCGLGRLIEASDFYIGYDSCGQHITNSANTPAVIIFAGAPSARFISRWSPNNPTTTTIPILRDKDLNQKELATVSKKVLEAVKHFKDSRIS